MNIVFRRILPVLAVCLLAGGPLCAAERMEIKLKGGKTRTVAIIAPEDKGIRIQVGDAGESFIPWDQIEPVSVYEVTARFLEDDNAKAWVSLGDYCLKNELLPQARDCYEKALKIDAALEPVVREKLARVRGELLVGTVSVRLKNRDLDDALRALARAADVEITLDDKLRDAIRKAPRDKKPKVTYEVEDTTFEIAIRAILDPLKLQYMEIPGGVSVYSRQIGIGPETANTLAAALKDAAVEDRLQAASALAHLHAPNAVPVLRDAARQENPKVRLAAVTALATFREPGVEDALWAAARDPYHAIRTRALDGLASRVGGGENAPGAIRRLIECAETAPSEVSRRAAQMLARVNTFDAAKMIADRLREKKIRDYNTRRDLVEALGRLGDVRSTPLLREFLQQDDGSLYRDAPEALARLADRGSIPLIVALIEKRKDDWTTKSNCCKALIMLGGGEAIAAVMTVFRSETDDNRRAAVLALFQESVPYEEVEPVLIEHLASDKERIRHSAAAALQRIGSTAAVEPLIQSLEKHDKDWRFVSTLRTLTGQSFREHKDWKKWWDENKEGFAVKRTGWGTE